MLVAPARNVAECLHQVALGTRCLPTGYGALQFSSYTRTTVAKADGSIQLLHVIHRGSIVAPTRDGSSPSSFTINVLQKLSLLSCARCKAVTYTPSTPSIYNTVTHTSPQPPQTRTPLLSSSTISGFGSRHSGQSSLTFRSGPNVCAFC